MQMRKCLGTAEHATHIWVKSEEGMTTNYRCVGVAETPKPLVSVAENVMRYPSKWCLREDQHTPHVWSRRENYEQYGYFCHGVPDEIKE